MLWTVTVQTKEIDILEARRIDVELTVELTAMQCNSYINMSKKLKEAGTCPDYDFILIFIYQFYYIRQMCDA